MDLSIAYKTLQFIHSQCSDASKQASLANATKTKDANMATPSDAFQQAKRQLHLAIKEANAAISERDALSMSSASGGNSMRRTDPRYARRMVELSAVVRNALRMASENLECLEQIASSDEQALNKKLASLSDKSGSSHSAGNNSKASSKGMSAAKAEALEAWRRRVDEQNHIVQLGSAHLRQSIEADKRRFGSTLTGTFLGNNNGAIGSRTTNHSGSLTGSPVKMSSHSGIQNMPTLPDICPEEELVSIDLNARQLDADLQEISSGVGTLRSIALGMERQIEGQTELIDAVQHRTDKAQDNLNTVHNRMKTTLDRVMKGDRFIANAILLLILLGLLAFIFRKL